MIEFKTAITDDLSEEKEKEMNYYFTFGCGQAHPNGFVKIHGMFESAREEMVRRYSDKWCFQYPEESFLPQIERFGLKEVA